MFIVRNRGEDEATVDNDGGEFNVCSVDFVFYVVINRV